ncbi:MAG: flagellar protein FlgN [Gammaproteobacteria bacterium]|nr:flagellar protein FlgN [Gammaproteobacteria bacterium]
MVQQSRPITPEFLNNAIDTASKLLALLEREQQCLVDGDMEHLDALADAKLTHVCTLQSMDAEIAMAPPSQNLTALQNVLRACQQTNEANASHIAIQRQHSERLRTLVTSLRSDGACYRPDGSVQAVPTHSRVDTEA